jgi:hypothetical protein
MKILRVHWLMASSIEIDCAPMRPRPDTYLPMILEGTGLAVDDFDIVSKVFGCWTYQVHPDKETLYQGHVDVIRHRIESLYHSGSIRYGSW